MMRNMLRASCTVGLLRMVARMSETLMMSGSSTSNKDQRIAQCFPGSVIVQQAFIVAGAEPACFADALPAMKTEPE